MSKVARRTFLKLSAAAGCAGMLCIAGCAERASVGESEGAVQPVPEPEASQDESAAPAGPQSESEAVEQGLLTLDDATDRGFTVDNVYHSPDEGDIHFSLYLPDNYGNGTHALYIALPGYEGLYFQGPGENLHEEFPFAAQRYDRDMIIASPQLDDWDDPSARQAVALTRFLMSIYPIDASRVFISGYSGGGETLSLALDQAPELYAAALHCSSQWDGGFDALVQARTPVRFAIGEGDEYYGPEPAEDAYAQIHSRYEDEGLESAEISELVMLDEKDDAYFADYFAQGGQPYQHAAGAILFAQDEEVMDWLFSHVCS